MPAHALSVPPVEAREAVLKRPGQLMCEQRTLLGKPKRHYKSTVTVSVKPSRKTKTPLQEHGHSQCQA